MAKAKQWIRQATRAWLFFVQRRPAEAGGYGGPVVFTLMKILRAAEIKTEHLVGKIEPYITNCRPCVMRTLP